MTYVALILSLILPPCTTEDSANCYWDASTRGNGQGVSFVDVAGHVIYLPT